MGNIYTGVNDIARKVNKIYVGDSNGVARQVQKVYVGDSNGIARQVYSAFTPVIYAGTVSFSDTLPWSSSSRVNHDLSSYFVITPSMIQEAAALGYTKVYLDFTVTWTSYYSGSTGSGSLITQSGQNAGTEPSSGGYSTFFRQLHGNQNLPNIYVTFPTNLNENLKIFYSLIGRSDAETLVTTTVSNVRFGV